MTARSTRSTRGAPGALALLMLFLALTIAPAARAADPDDPAGTEDGWKKVVEFAGCAFSVFRAISPGDWTAAFLTCSKVYLAEAASTSGGA